MSPTIVLIPGLMNDAWVWHGQLGALGRIGPIHIACNDGCDSLGAMAERVLAATAGPLAVVGHSMGGRVALEIVARAPDRVAALALLSTGAHPAAPGEAEGRLALVDLAEHEGMAAVAAQWLPPMHGPGAGAEVRAGITAMLERADPAIFSAQQTALIERPDRTVLLAEIAVPTLIATGEHDGWASPAQHLAMAEAIPGARLEIVPGAGHMLPVEASDRLSSLLADFLGNAVARRPSPPDEKGRDGSVAATPPASRPAPRAARCRPGRRAGAGG